MLVKHVHWNVRGPGFRNLHLHLDEIAGELERHADALAERLAAIGAAPDGRATSVVNDSLLEEPPIGPIAVHDGAELVASALDLIGVEARAGFNELDGTPVDEDLLVQLLASLDHQRWLVSAEIADA